MHHAAFVMLSLRAKELSVIFNGSIYFCEFFCYGFISSMEMELV